MIDGAIRHEWILTLPLIYFIGATVVLVVANWIERRGSR